jgi:hypothetical protein
LSLKLNTLLSLKTENEGDGDREVEIIDDTDKELKMDEVRTETKR